MKKNEINPQMSTVSIIVPIYNEEEHLERCIESVLNQVYTNFELLLIDDGSTDNTGEICDKYVLKDSRIRVFHRENGGVSKARNFGISQAIGEWVMFLDSDDYLFDNALSVLINQALKTQTLITCANLFIEKEGKREVVCTGIRSGVISNNFRAIYFHSVNLCTGVVLYHFSIIKDKRFDEMLTRGEDVVFRNNLLRVYKLSYTNKCIMVYSLDDRGLSAKCSDRYKDHVFHMTFEGKSFWEKMVMAETLNGSFELYSEFKNELYSKYKKYIIYTKLDCKIRRFKKYKRNLYKKIFNL